jgi:hypothetical protein
MSAVVKLVEKAVTAVVDTVKAVIQNPIPTIVSLAGQAIGIPAPVTMAAMTAAQGGSLEDIAKSAVISYAAPTVTSSVASAIAPTVSSVISNEAAAQAVTNATSKALVNGAVSAASGGDFGDAAAGTMAGSLVASGYKNLIAPAVQDQAKDLGLTSNQADIASNLLGSGVSVGAAAAASGKDFASGFEAGASGYATDIATSSISNALKTVAKSNDIAVNDPTDAGIPEMAVNDVPISPNAEPGTVLSSSGMPVGEINPDSASPAYDQVLAAFQAPMSPGVGTQLGQPTAELSGGIIPSNATASDVQIDVPKVDFTPSQVGDEKSLPEVTVTADQLGAPTIDETNADILSTITGNDTSPISYQSPDLTSASTSGYDYFSNPLNYLNFSQQTSPDAKAQAELQQIINKNTAATYDPMADMAALGGTTASTSSGYDPTTDLAAFGGSEPSYTLPTDPATGLPLVGGLPVMPAGTGTTAGAGTAAGASAYGVPYAAPQPSGGLPTAAPKPSGSAQRNSALMAYLNAQNQAGVLGDLGMGITVTPNNLMELLEPTMLAKGGLARLKTI